MSKYMSTKQIQTAFILGAGLGTRLRPLTENMPKPLLEIGGRPIITYAMARQKTIPEVRIIEGLEQ
jgi:mannose-1-phosphate guanylyltransferase